MPVGDIHPGLIWNDTVGWQFPRTGDDMAKTMFGEIPQELLDKAKAENDAMIEEEDFQALGICTCAACWKQIAQDEFRINLNGSLNVHTSCYAEAFAVSAENYMRAKVRAEIKLLK